MFIFSTFKIKQKLNCQLIFQLFRFMFPSWHSSINGKWALSISCIHPILTHNLCTQYRLYSYILFSCTFLACRIWMSFRIIMLWVWELFQLVCWKGVGGQKAKSNWIIAKQWKPQRNIIRSVNALFIHHPPLRIVRNRLLIAVSIFTCFFFSFSMPYRRKGENENFPVNITHRLQFVGVAFLWCIVDVS